MCNDAATGTVYPEQFAVKNEPDYFPDGLQRIYRFIFAKRVIYTLFLHSLYFPLSLIIS